MFKGRNTRDLETLAGRRGNTGQRAVLWDEIDQITRRVAQSFTDGGVSTGGGSAGAIDESALEDYIANTSPSVQQINQTIDSTTTFIGNLTADARATLPDLDQAITDARNDALDAVNVAQGEIDTLTGAYTGTLPDLEAAITAARNDATAQIDTAETGLQSQINGVSADLTNNYYTIVQSDSAISSAVTTLESSLLTEINNIIAAGDGSETVQTLSARLDADFFTKTETNTAISAATTSLEASLQTDISEVAETLPNFDFSQGITGWRGKAIDQGSYSIVTGPEFIGGQAFRQVGVLNSTNFLAPVDSRKTVIDTARAYRVKARFRVVGTVPSEIFFSIRFEDVNGNYISDYCPAGFGLGVNNTPVQNNGAWVSVSIMSGIGTDNPFPAGAFKAYPLISLGNQQGPDSIVELDELALLEVTDSREVAATLEQNYLTIAETDQAISTATTALQSSLESQIGTLNATLTEDYFTSADTTQAISAAQATLQSNIDTVSANLTSEQATRANADSALTTSLNTLTTRVGSAEAEIAGEQIARSDADNALAVDISTLTTRVGDAESDITSEQTARTDADSAIAIDLSALTTRVDTAESSIISESIVSSNADDALASDITALTTRVDGAEADITSEQSARASADSALATDITSLTTRVGSAEAEIAGEQIARSNADSALASDISTVSANLATTDASVTQTANAVATIESFAGATYTLRALAGAAEGVLELVAADDPINGPNSALRIDVTQVNIEGRLNADWITGGFIRANQIQVDDLLFLDGDTAGFSIDKVSAYDTANDGIYMGRTNELDGSIGFGLAFSKTDDITGLRQSIEATRRNGVRLFNANHYRTLSVPLNPLLYTDPQTVDLTGYSRVDIFLVGGGAGGNAGDLDGQGTAGGDTVVVLKDGATVIETWTAVGGQPEVESVRNRAPATRGESSPWGTGGAAGANLSYETYERNAGGEGDTRLATRPVDETSGGNATGYGAGGGGGGASQPQDGGGLGGQSSPLVSIVGYDISGMSAPTLEITDIGAAGLGASGSASGGGGSPGRVQVAESNSEDIPADVIPLLATQKGSASSHGPFPDYGAGFWVFHTLDGTSLNMGKIELDESGGEVIATTSDYISLVSAKTPDVIIPAGISKTIRFLFFKMGP